MQPSQLHLICGDSAAGTLRQALGGDPESVLACRDVLSCGPLPPFNSLEKWRNLRVAYWRKVNRDTDADGYEPDVLPSRSELLRAKSVHLWAGLGLSNQLLLPWTVRYFELIGADIAKLSIVQFSQIPGTKMMAGELGILDVQEMQRHPKSRPISEKDIEELRDTWGAITAPEPGPLLAALARKRPRFVFLQRALKGLISRYPDEQRGGLNHWDSELLKCAHKYGPKLLHVIGYTMANNLDFLDPVVHTYLLARLRQLADHRRRAPAVVLSGDLSQMHKACQVKLTSFGRAVLAGRKSFLDSNGIDDWVAGVHLQSASGRVWVRRGEELIPS